MYQLVGHTWFAPLCPGYGTWGNLLAPFLTLDVSGESHFEKAGGIRFNRLLLGYVLRDGEWLPLFQVHLASVLHSGCELSACL